MNLFCRYFVKKDGKSCSLKTPLLEMEPPADSFEGTFTKKEKECILGQVKEWKDSGRYVRTIK
jgi:hypothetical protein